MNVRKSLAVAAAGLCSAALLPTSLQAEAEPFGENWGYKFTGLGEQKNEVALVFTNTTTTMEWQVPSSVKSVWYLAIGGGGAGGNQGAGGGGAGGFLEEKSYAVTPGGTLAIAVGAGGDKANGANTTIGDDVVAYGGGMGGTNGKAPAGSGSDGGCGGGENAYTTSTAPGNGSQGGNGGDGFGRVAGGGGGGAGGDGGAGQCYDNNKSAGGVAGLGGLGRESDITGVTVAYAGGGGGGGNVVTNLCPVTTNTAAGFTGPFDHGGYAVAGGGQGGTDAAAAQAGTDGLGGGGGGGGVSKTGGARGGNGVVIIRYVDAPAGQLEVPDPVEVDYNGGVQYAPFVTGDDYTVTGNDGWTDAGSHEITLTPNTGKFWKGGSTEATNVLFTINPLQNAWTVEPSITKTQWYVGGEAGVLTAGATTYGAVTAAIVKNGGEPEAFTGTELPTEQGVYTITYAAPEGTKNILAPAELCKVVQFTISLEGAVARVGYDEYATLAEAVAAADGTQDVVVLADCEGDGIVIDKSVTIDFGGFTYTVNGATVGSTGTETQAFQLHAGNTIVFKNGTITSTTAKMLVQNYANLTLKGMTLDGASLTDENTAYTLSTNNGSTTIDDTTIIARETNGVAFDVCSFGGYTANAVEVKGTSNIQGTIELSTYNNVVPTLTLTSGTFLKNALVLGDNGDKVVVTKDPSLDYPRAPDGYVFTKDTNTLKRSDDVAARIKDIGYFATFAGAFEAATEEKPEVVFVQTNITETLVVPAKKLTLEFKNGYNYAKITTAGAGILLQGGDVTLLHGEIESGNVAIAFAEGAVNGTLTVQSSHGNGYVGRESAVSFNLANSCTVNIAGGRFEATDNAVIRSHGNPGCGDHTLNITGGTFIGRIESDGYSACGLYWANSGTANLAGGEFNVNGITTSGPTNGAIGIVARAGTVTVTNTQFTIMKTDAAGFVGDAKSVLPSAAFVFDAQAAYPALTAEDAIVVSGVDMGNGSYQHLAAIRGEGSIYVGQDLTNRTSTVWTEEGYVLKAAAEKPGYNKVAVKSAIPTVTVEEIIPAPEGLDVAYTYTADEAGKGAESSYADWNCDFYVSFDKAIEADSVTLAGSYDAYQEGAWQSFTLGALAADEEVALVKDLVKWSMTYADVCDIVQTFRCGVKNNAGNDGTVMKVVLRLTKEGEEAIDIDTTEYTLVDPQEEPLPPGDIKITFDDANAATNKADAINADIGSYVKAPGDAPTTDGYLDLFEAKVSWNGSTGKYDVIVELTAEGAADLQEAADASVAAALEDGEIETIPGLYYTFLGGTDVTVIATAGEKTLATEETTTVPKPDLGETTSAFYKLVIETK